MLYKKLIEDRLSDKIILRHDTHEFSYRNLYDGSLALGYSWAVNGAQRGDRVVVACSDPSETVIALLACLAFGFVFVPVERDTCENDKKYIIENCGAQIVFTGGIPQDKVPIKRDILPKETVGYIIYTSGSTNIPKGVVAPFAAIDFCIEAINKRLCNSESDRILCKLPLSFDYGLYQVFLALRYGAELTLMGADNSILSIPKLLAERKITAFPAVPTMLAALLRANLLKGDFFPSLRYICSTGEALSVNLIAGICVAMPNVSVVPMYGLTECKRVSIMPFGSQDKIMSGSCGLPLDGVEVRLNAENSDEGELIVYGPNIMNGYWGDEETTTKVFGVDENGKRFLRTGDSFSIDEDGFLYFRKRLKNMIKVGGHAVSGTEIEEFLKVVDGVLDVSVIGLPDDVYGELICACVYTLVPDVREKIRKISETLPFYRRIRRIIIYDKPFPTNKNGKVDITALRIQAGGYNEV